MGDLLQGRVAIVTGAGRGIGASIARLYAANGASVVLNDLGTGTDGSGSDDGPAEAVAAEIRAAGGQAVADGGDITEPSTAEELVRLARENFGGLHVVVNTAGILRDRMIFNLEPEDWDAVIRVHLRGAYATSHAATAYWRSLRDPDGGFRIINFTSDSGLYGSPGQPNYAAAKMGVVGLTYSLAQALGRYGVTANAIAPAAMTRLVVGDGVDPATSSSAAELTPDNVAPLVTYLASLRSGWLTGRVLGAVGRTVTLFNNPEVVASLESPGDWNLDWLAEGIEREFRPLADGVLKTPFVGTGGGRGGSS